MDSAVDRLAAGANVWVADPPKTGRMRRRRGIRLTERDLEWLRMLADGQPIKALHQNERKVRARLMAIRRLMKVLTTTQAVAEALRQGAIQ